MPISPFWRAVGEVAGLLLAVSLLNVLSGMILGVFAIGVFAPILGALQGAIAVAGALTYMSWRWGWQADTIGLTGARNLRWLPAGLGLGLGALVLTWALSIPFGYGLIPAVNPTTTGLVAALPFLVSVLAVEVVYRGGATARLQADLAPKEALWTALVLPLVAYWLGGFLAVQTGIQAGQPWTLFFTAALTLLYLRTGSLWLNLGLHGVVVLVPVLLGLRLAPQAALLLWAVVVAILLYLEWKRIERMPRRLGPTRHRAARR